jgi:hypothetical protein
MNPNAYAPGNVARLSAVFRNAAGAEANPTTVTLRYRKPGAATVSVTTPDALIVNDAAGRYHFDLALSNDPGVWEYRWESTGDPTAAVDLELQLLASDLAA